MANANIEVTITGMDIIESMLKDLHTLADIKGHRLHNILFRNAGVAIQFFSTQRAGSFPFENDLPDNATPHEMGERVRIQREWYKSGLYTDRYYRSLTEAIQAETRRLHGLPDYPGE